MLPGAGEELPGRHRTAEEGAETASGEGGAGPGAGHETGGEEAQTGPGGWGAGGAGGRGIRG